jgi:hypothetical protein
MNQQQKSNISIAIIYFSYLGNPVAINTTSTAANLSTLAFVRPQQVPRGMQYVRSSCTKHLRSPRIRERSHCQSKNQQKSSQGSKSPSGGPDIIESYDGASQSECREENAEDLDSSCEVLFGEVDHFSP